MFVISVVALGYIGSKPPEEPYLTWARVFTAYYFLHLLVLLPIIGVIETPKPLPRSISEAVLGKEPAKEDASAGRVS
jgi:ubiquinol-cytochrome c reductase cytochrome b subunit